jgi:hypothetical protein
MKYSLNSNVDSSVVTYQQTGSAIRWNLFNSSKERDLNKKSDYSGVLSATINLDANSGTDTVQDYTDNKIFTALKLGVKAFNNFVISTDVRNWAKIKNVQPLCRLIIDNQFLLNSLITTDVVSVLIASLFNTKVIAYKGVNNTVIYLSAVLTAPQIVLLTPVKQVIVENL